MNGNTTLGSAPLGAEKSADSRLEFTAHDLRVIVDGDISETPISREEMLSCAQAVACQLNALYPSSYNTDIYFTGDDDEGFYTVHHRYYRYEWAR